jgi:hypothetical protein
MKFTDREDSPETYGSVMLLEDIGRVNALSENEELIGSELLLETFVNKELERVGAVQILISVEQCSSIHGNTSRT